MYFFSMLFLIILLILNLLDEICDFDMCFKCSKRTKKDG